MKKSIIEIMDELTKELKEVCLDSLVELCEAVKTSDGASWERFDFDADEEAMTEEEVNKFYEQEESYITWLETKKEELCAAIYNNVLTRGMDIKYLTFDEDWFDLELEYKDWNFVIEIANGNSK